MVTWVGSTVTPKIMVAQETNQNTVVFAIVNTFRSRSRLDILRLVNQYDNDEAPTGTVANRVVPLIRVRRVAAADVSGGVEIKARPAWDTATNNPDPGVKLLFNPGDCGGPDTIIVANNRSGPLWQQYTMRQASAVEQVLSWDNACICSMTARNDFFVSPGEAIVVEQQDAIPTGGTSFYQVAWEESRVDDGYVVGGSVNLAGSPVSGATVIIVTDSNAHLPSPEIEIMTTGDPGTFSKTLASGVKSSVFVQHESGPTKYTDEGKPFIEKA